MKKQLLSIAVTLTMIIPMSIIGFAGLYSVVSAKIPFDFMVSGKEFKAGAYTVSWLYAGCPNSTLAIRDAGNVALSFFPINSTVDKDGQRARLIFHRYGNQYFLVQIFDGQSETGCALIKSKAEREAEKKRDTVTQNTFEPETVMVVAQIGR